MSKRPMLLVGGGGHCRSCIDVIEQGERFVIAGIVEKASERGKPGPLGYPVIGTDEEFAELRERYGTALVTVGQIKTAEPRSRLYGELKRTGFELPVIVSPLAHVSRHSEVEQGTIVMHHALINAGARVGANCIVNSKALVEHDVIIEADCHIACGVVLCGGVHIGEGSFVGSNVTCREGIKIGARSVVGAGTKVLRDLPSDSVYLGR